MDLGHQRTGGVDRQKFAAFWLPREPILVPMGGKDHRRASVRNLFQLLNEDRSLALELVDDIAIMDDFVAHIDRGRRFPRACSTTSMARTTPAQNPRGAQR